MNDVYFSKDGLTSTECNHLANVSKELAQAVQERLANLTFINTKVAVIGSSEKQLMSTGVVNLESICADLNYIAQLNSFCAWVREAIKEKEKRLEDISKCYFEKWCIDKGISFNCPDIPTKPVQLTKVDILNSWDMDKQNEYYQTEAFAATIGKYIHPNGAYSNARKELHKALSNPITKDGTGRDTILFYTSESVPVSDVDDLFLKLQGLHRQYEKKLNQLKFEIMEEVNKQNIELENQYIQQVIQYEKDYAEYNALITKTRSSYTKWLTDEREKASLLKIAIPKDLMNIYQIVKEAAN